MLAQLQQTVATALALLMLLLGLWGLLMGLLKRSVGGSFRSTYVLSIAVFGLQAIVGLIMLVSGLRPRDTLHVLYGIVPFLALGYAFGYSGKMTPRRESFTLAIACLFTFGLVLRAFSTGR